MALVSRADLLAPSRSDPARTNAQVSVDRMRSTAAPMPPGGLVAASETAVLADWVAAGSPAGSCLTPPPGTGSGGTGTGGTGSPPPDVTPRCTSDTWWTGGAGSRMRPGEACIACHARSREGPSFRVAGTVYPSLHEPDDCNGTSAPTVVVTDASGTAVSLRPNSAGNFTSKAALRFPLRVKVTAGGRVREMSGTIASGDCNSCHTQSGANGAPGRVVAP